MHQHYHDILALTDRKPVWWQEGGIPRFCEFAPQELPDIYADEAAILLIKCQACGEKFYVSMSTNQSTRFGTALRNANGNNERALAAQDKYSIAARIRAGTLHWGDPPNIDCCASGASMTSELIQVVEYHRRRDPIYCEGGVVKDYEAYTSWRRNPDLEGPLPSKSGAVRR